jgi:hypothetical protein
VLLRRNIRRIITQGYRFCISRFHTLEATHLRRKVRASISSRTRSSSHQTTNASSVDTDELFIAQPPTPVIPTDVPTPTEGRFSISEAIPTGRIEREGTTCQVETEFQEEGRPYHIYETRVTTIRVQHRTADGRLIWQLFHETQRVQTLVSIRYIGEEVDQTGDN